MSFVKTRARTAPLHTPAPLVARLDLAACHLVSSGRNRTLKVALIGAGPICWSSGEAAADVPGLGANDAIAWVSCAVALFGGAPATLADTPLIDHSRPTWPIGAVPVTVLLPMS